MLANTYPLLDFFWTMLWFFCFFIYLWLLIRIFSDIFRSHDLGGGAKTLWVIFVIFLPFLGILVYLIARGKHMAQRDARAAADAQNAFDAEVKRAAGTNTAEALTKLSELHDRGALTDAEFEAQKSKILG